MRSVFVFAFWSLATSAAGADLQKVASEVSFGTMALSVETKAGDTREGSGFVVGAESGFVYVATANHNLRGDRPGKRGAIASRITATLPYRDSNLTVEGDLLSPKDRKCDLGVFRIKAPNNFLWSANVLNPALPDSTGQALGRIGKLEFDGERYVLSSGGRDGSASQNAGETTLNVVNVQVEKGDSGSPLISDAGIVGMLIKQSPGGGVACSINAIREHFENWGLPWGLYETTRNSPSLEGAWQQFVDGEPGGAIQITQDSESRSRYRVEAFDNYGYPAGSGEAAFSGDSVEARVAMISGVFLAGRFSLSPNLPQPWKARSVTLVGEMSVYDDQFGSAAIESNSLRLVFLGKNLTFGEVDQKAVTQFNPNAGYIRLPTAKGQKAFSGTEWCTKMLDLTGNALVYEPGDRRNSFDRWGRKAAIRLNANNSISVRWTTSEAYSENFDHTWTVEDGLILLRFDRFRNQFELPVPAKVPPLLRGRHLTDGTVLMELRRSSAQTQGNECVSQAPPPSAATTQVELTGPPGTSVFGKHFAELSDERRALERSWGWWRSDLRKATRIAKEYGVTTQAVMSIANTVDKEDRNTPLTPEELVFKTGRALNYMGQFNTVDIIASIEDPRFRQLIRDVSTTLGAMKKKELSLYEQQFERVESSVIRFLTQCRTFGEGALNALPIDSKSPVVCPRKWTGYATAAATPPTPAKTNALAGTPMAKSAPRQPDSAPSGTRIELAGEWTEVFFNHEFGVARIKQEGDKLYFWNHMDPPHTSEGFIDEQGRIHATDWGLEAELIDNGAKLFWSNMVIWNRK